MRAGAVAIMTFFIDVFSGVRKRIGAVDRVVAAEVALIVLLIFGKICINGLFVAEKSKIGDLRYRLKLVESESKRVKAELGKYKNRERLSDLSKSIAAESNIDVVIVKQ